MNLCDEIMNILVDLYKREVICDTRSKFLGTSQLSVGRCSGMLSGL